MSHEDVLLLAKSLDGIRHEVGMASWALWCILFFKSFYKSE